MLFTGLFKPPSQHLLSHLSAPLVLLLALSFSCCQCCRWSAGSDPSLPWLCAPPRLEPSLQHSLQSPGHGHKGGMVTSTRELGASVSSQERSPQQAVASQSPGGGFLWGKIIVTWLAVPQINGCDSLQCFRQKMATCCCSEIVLSAGHTAPLEPLCLAKVAGILDREQDPDSNIKDVWGMEAKAGDLGWI